jgi:hypothetical protein
LSDAGLSTVRHRTGAQLTTARAGSETALLFPFALAAAFLFALGLLTGWHARNQSHRASMYAGFGTLDVPVAYSSSECRNPLGSTSSGRLMYADVLALLATQ